MQRPPSSVKTPRDSTAPSRQAASMRTAIVLEAYPRPSEIFIAQEILAMERRGLVVEIISLRYPRRERTHSTHDQIRAPVHYLPEYLYREFTRVWRAWRRVRRWPGYQAARARWLADLKRDWTVNRIRRFGQALVLASELEVDIQHLHAHFLHTPASVARYAARLKDLTWSCSAHAAHVWTTPVWEIKEKLSDLQWLVTCTQLNAKYLKNLAPAPSKISFCYHGLDMSQFHNDDLVIKSGSPVRFLSVGHAVEKKGYEDLLEAFAALPEELEWTFTHIGDGPRLKTLKRKATSAGLNRQTTWLGVQTEEEVIHAYRNADVFILPCKIARNGDRDSLPSVLLEAQSQGLACISTRVSAIPELILHEETGLLAAPGDPEDLARQITRFIDDFDLRKRLAEAGRARVMSEFSFADYIETVAIKFGLDKTTTAPKTA